MANLINVPNILAAAHARQAGRRRGRDREPALGHRVPAGARTPSNWPVAKALLASPDIDLILGCHVHVPQPFQEINGKWVAYGMGNQIATQPFSKPTQDGVMPRFTFTETTPGHFQVTKAEAIPTFDYMGQDGGPYRLIDLPRALADPNLDPRRKALYEASWKRTASEVDKMGGGRRRAGRGRTRRRSLSRGCAEQQREHDRELQVGVVAGERRVHQPALRVVGHEQQREQRADADAATARAAGRAATAPGSSNARAASGAYRGRNAIHTT